MTGMRTVHEGSMVLWCSMCLARRRLGGCVLCPACRPAP